MTDDVYLRECQDLGKACARALMRCDNKAPPAFKEAYRSYRGPKSVPGYFDRKWLSLRLNAVKRGLVLDNGVTPGFLKKITPAYCPVTLEPIDVKGRSERNPSVDRLLNDGTYAPYNLVVLSIRANRAKAEHTFEDIEALILAEDDGGGLTRDEWSRLLALMHGAWNRSTPNADVGEAAIVPMTTYPPPHTITSTGQLVQLLLLQELTGPNYPEYLRFWLQVTAKGGGNVQALLELSDAIRFLAQQETEYLPNVWLNGTLFEAYGAWYVQCHEAIWDELEEIRQQNAQGFDIRTVRRGWRLNERIPHRSSRT